MSQGYIRPLSVGNIVSTGLTLYRSHLKTYLQLSAFAYLWVLVPIYGWAKYYAISGLISRLAFRELISQPESVSQARSHTNQRLWSFLGVAINAGIRLILVYFGLAILAGFIGAIIAAVLTPINPILGPIAMIVLVMVILLIGFTWYFARWMVAEVPLAVEDNINGGQSVKRSWELTKDSVRRIQLVVFIAFLVSLPLIGLTGYLPSILLLGIEQGSTLYWILYCINLTISMIGGALIMPFWQTIKAVLYYDLRSRREGLDLQIRELG